MKQRALVLLGMLGVLVTVVAAAGAVVAPPARAAGGGSIAAAPQLPIGVTVVGGANAVNGREFWRVTLAAGDKLTIDYQPVNGGSVSLYVFNPSVTDSTFGNASSVASGGTSSASEFTWTATGQGAWILDVRSDHGYQLTPNVKRWTTTRLNAPRHVRPGAWFSYRGSVGPSVSTGSVLLQRYMGRTWRTFATVKVAAGGTFAFRARFAKAAKNAKAHGETICALYRGDATHLSSQTTIHILVKP
jgi:hypothetical protein